MIKEEAIRLTAPISVCNSGKVCNSDKVNSMETDKPKTDADHRRADIEWKQQQIVDFLNRSHYDAMLLQMPENFSWFTAGTNCVRGNSSDQIAALFITADARVVITNDIDSVQLFERELAGYGFQLKQREWHESHYELIHDLCCGRTVASDTGFERTANVAEQLKQLRLTLGQWEITQARRLGKRLVHAVEAAARSCWQGRSEADLAGEVAHRLIKHQATPVRIQVAGDGRGKRYRHWEYSDQPINEYATISAVARRDGICLGVARTFSFHQPSVELRESYLCTIFLQATGLYFSQADWEFSDVWKRVERIYEKFGQTDEWRSAQQAELIGYRTTEILLTPQSSFRLSPGMMLFWHPSVNQVLGGESMLVGSQHFESLTPPIHWPTVTVSVKGRTIVCPGILQHDSLGTNSPDSNTADAKEFAEIDSFLGVLSNDLESQADLKFPVR